MRARVRIESERHHAALAGAAATAAAPAAAPAAASAVVPAQLGLQQAGPARVGNVRKAPIRAPPRKGEVWSSVTIVVEHATTPKVRCKFCFKEFSGGATRIRERIISKCTSETEQFCTLKDMLLGNTDAAESAKRQKTSEEEMLEQIEQKEESKVKADLRV